MSRRFQVLVVPEWYPWADQPGAGVWAHNQARAVALDHTVVVLACRAVPADEIRQAYEISEDERDGLRVLRVIYRAGVSRRAAFVNRLRGMLAVQAGLSDGGFKADVIHAHVFSSGFPALALGRRSGARVVVSEHYSGFPLGLLSRWDRMVARFTFNHADVVCPASDDLGRHLAQLAPRARLRTVANPVDTHVFYPAERPSREHPPEIRILNVGALKEGKGHRVLLDALARTSSECSDLRLTIIGDGPLRSQLEAHAGAVGIGEAVTFTGHLSPPEVAARMRQSDFLALPSLWENAPVAISEALATGLPVVASRVGGIPELVSSPAGLLVPPGDAGALADALLAMSSGFPDVDTAKLSTEAVARHGPRAVADRWSDIYRSALGGERRSPSRKRTKRIWKHGSR